MSEDPEIYEVDKPETIEAGITKLNREYAQDQSLMLSLGELAQRKGAEPNEVVKAMSDALATLRLASIQLTSPEDWLLFNRDGHVSGYLQDQGAERVAPLWGIQITNVSNHEKIPIEGGGFLYVIRGDGRSAMTKKEIVAVEGGRASTDDIFQGLSGAALELKVRKAARANLDGSIVRDLTGLSNVPLIVLEAAWKSNPEKLIENCPRGRGFGSQAERIGVVGEYGEAPVCPVCNIPMKLRRGKDNRGDFWGCSNYKTCGTKPVNAVKGKPAEKAPEPENPKPNGGDKKPANWGLIDKKNNLLDRISGLKHLTAEQRSTFTTHVLKANSEDDLMDVIVELEEAGKAKTT